MKKLNIREKTVDFPEGEFTVFLNKGCVVDFTKESPPIPLCKPFR